MLTGKYAQATNAKATLIKATLPRADYIYSIIKADCVKATNADDTYGHATLQFQGIHMLKQHLPRLRFLKATLLQIIMRQQQLLERNSLSLKLLELNLLS